MGINIRDGQFFKDGAPVVLAMRTSFCLLGHYQAGRRDTARRWLDRIAAQGFDGPRLFGENQDWFPGDTFFGTSYTPIVLAFGDHSGPLSKLKLIAGYESGVQELAEDLVARDMVAEFCCIATIKGRDPAWTSHGLNKFAQMFARLFPDPDDTPFLHEAINEWDAHSKLDAAEVARIGNRWRRSNDDPTHHNYPGSTIGVSAGGEWSLSPPGYTHTNIHPPRGGNWKSGDGEPLAKTIFRLSKDKPLYLNETIHYMSQPQWDEWITRRGISKWAGLSTTDHDGLAQYLLDVGAAGASFCFHDLVGMSTDPDAPITPGEEAIAEMLGGAPPPPPPPQMVAPIVGIVQRGYRDILNREADPSGLKHYHDRILGGTTEAEFREWILRDYLGGAR